MPVELVDNGIRLFGQRDTTIRKWAELATLDIGSPAWSHDGKYIYFDATPPDGVGAFLRIKISDRKLEQVAAKNDSAQYVP